MLLYWWWFGGSVGRGSCGGSYSGSCGSLEQLVEQLVVALGQLVMALLVTLGH